MPETKVVSELTQEVANHAVLQSTGTVTLRDARRNFERRYILMVLEMNQWRVGATARALGLQRPNLYRKARQLSIALRPTDQRAV